MSQTVPAPSDLGQEDPPPTVERIGRDLYLATAMRLVSQQNPDLEHAGRRLVATAPTHGIDLSMAFATVDRAGRRPSVRQCCLVVPGSGRTCMTFVSEPPPGGDPGGRTVGVRERTACLREACAWLEATMPERVRVAQCLPEPRETWTIDAANAAGFISVGTLAYMRRELGGKRDAGLKSPPPPLPAGVRIRRLSEARDIGDVALAACLDRTYEGTLDCPELCGLRLTCDILDSHKAVGVFDPTLWWLAFDGEDPIPAGCMLLNRCPEQRTIELVYIGLGTSLRGRGLAKTMMLTGLREINQHHTGWTCTCAVDHRNTPARRLYDALGFTAFTDRIALVRPLGSARNSS